MLDAVETAAARLDSVPGPLFAEERTALAAYEWVAGHCSHSPITGVAALARPDDILIRAEERAARTMAIHEKRHGGVRRFATGGAHALAWVLGESDDQP
ncbi:hypothetical protein [Streptomyces sp. CBMA123]|uniref:hypothetical protein n=1 Tax=Streptomyces sp. CBMA123 TaxID=1896313 RepID=UPI00166219E6|nr:hypothetical protein [Streptomyces sp. CBMA123]